MTTFKSFHLANLAAVMDFTRFASAGLSVDLTNFRSVRELQLNVYDTKFDGKIFDVAECTEKDVIDLEDTAARVYQFTYHYDVLDTNDYESKII